MQEIVKAVIIKTKKKLTDTRDLDNYRMFCSRVAQTINGITKLQAIRI